ncbi:carboxypeptidase A1-like isoform X2 [Paramisgurnus dabryanus]|uniref:carboxypeptidase A1-like isoform X2 n=1 Tax=Paramisgurnus dabryanus TaxID=90735 RepID=UPI003CCFACAA
MKLYLYQAIFTLLVCEGLIKGDQVFRIHAETEDHLEVLNKLKGNRELDFWTDGISTALPVDIRVPHASLYAVKKFLNGKKIPFTVMINNELLDKEKAEMRKNAAMESSSKIFNFTTYHTLDEIYSWMDTLVAAHSNVVSKVDIGKSYENRPMYVLKFSTGGAGKPAIWIDAGIHAREWISHATAVWIANQIATDFASKRAPVPKILGVMDIYMLIVANPDGYVFSHTSPNELYRFWRKNRSVTSNPKCRGVDINRNWDAEFGTPGASDDPCAEDYRGPSANSEIEVKNMANFIVNNANFKSFITLHSFKQLLMYPYGYTGKDTPDKSELHSVALSAANALKSWHGTVYQVGSIFSTIEQASGASIDWAYNRGIKYSYAFELRDTGTYGFLLPADQIVSTSRETWLAIKYIMNYVCDKL